MFVCVLLLLISLLPAVGAAEKPKIRAVTAFVRIDRAAYRQQVQEALAVLRRAKAAFEQAGYEVQSIRIATQPFGEYTRGLSTSEAVTFFQEYEKLAKAEGFDAAIGPAMFAPGSDPREADLLADVLSKNLLLNASLTVADENGVRWDAVRVAARVMKRLQQETPGGIANFNFAAAALVRPHTPFFPAAYHGGPGCRFAVALQSANVVAEAFASAGNIVGRFGPGLLHETYGSTEAGIVTNLRPPDQLRKQQCVGQPFPATLVEIRRDDGSLCKADEVGELFSTSPYLFNGYWKNPAATAEAWRDGWVTVGDMARRDAEGHIYIVDRKKDMVISGGINIYPREIEEVLLRHPAIAEVGVVGVPDEKWGEKLKAFVVVRPGESLAVDGVIEFCTGRISAIKV